MNRKINIRWVYHHYAIDGREVQVHKDKLFIPSTEYKPDPRLNRDARKFWYSVGLDGLEPCDGGVVATHRGRVVGFCRVYFYDYRGESELTGGGTWVSKPYRGRGLATRMWDIVLRRIKPEYYVHFTPTSDEGKHLVMSLMRRHPNIDFSIDGYNDTSVPKQQTA